MRGNGVRAAQSAPEFDGPRAPYSRHATPVKFVRPYQIHRIPKPAYWAKAVNAERAACLHENQTADGPSGSHESNQGVANNSDKAIPGGKEFATENSSFIEKEPFTGGGVRECVPILAL